MQNKEKTFVILSPGFAASETDTSCLPMQQSFVKNLSTLYPAIEIIVLSFQYPFQKHTYKWFGATVMSFGGKNKAGVSKFFMRRQINKVLQKLNAQKDIVGILSFWLGECASIGKKFATKSGIRHYCWLLGQDARKNNSYVKHLYPAFDEMIALSEFLQDEFERNHGIRPFAVIPPGIECVVNETSRDIDLLAVGSLITLKQFEIFIESVAAIKQKIPEIKAMLVGEGIEKNALINLIELHQIKENVSLVGKLDHNEVVSLMQRSKVLLHPSSYEGYSGVCQEALSCGTHVISFCRAMNKEIRQWHIVKSKNDMVEKAITLLQNKSTAYQPVNFPSMKTTARQMMDLYLSEV
jgi:glycosyltransferase involved in cell wall biosynthesis